MDFGKVAPELVETIDFTLPSDSSFTRETLERSHKIEQPSVYVGCAKWGRKEWVGKIYPKGTKEAQFLDHYVKHFNSIELNATHYQIYGEEMIGKWAAKAGNKDFLFCPKVPQIISHYSNLISADAQSNTDRFLQGIMAFGKHLGPVFFQVSENFSPAKKTNLYAYLKSLPRDVSFFLELRHPEWFADKALRNEWLHLLRDLNIGAVITDTSGRRDCAHMELTVPKTFVRFVGNNLHPTDYTRIDEWVQRIKRWLDNGLQQLYFFMHQHDEKDSPELCNYVIEQLNKHCGTKLQPVVFGVLF